MNLRSFIVISILLVPVPVMAQADTRLDVNESALTEELETIVSETETLNNKNAVVHLRSRSATLLSFSDSARAEKMFIATWKFINDQTDEVFDREQAKLVVLKHLFSRNPKLARRLLAERSKPADSSLPTRAADRDDVRLSAKLGSELIEADPASAAMLLEQSLSVAATPISLGALSRLREIDFSLADYVAAKALDQLRNQPTLVSLPGLHFFTGYAFPGSASSNYPTPANASLQSLQLRYFAAGYELLTASLQEANTALVKDQRYTQRDLQYRGALQGQIAAILAALAPRFQPLLAAELNELTRRLGSQVPANISQMTANALNRLSGKQIDSEDPEQKFTFALTGGDFDEARRQLDRLKEGEKKELYTQLLIKVEARALLKSDIMAALTAIRKLEDRPTQLLMYLDALKAAKKKNDPEVTKLVINEARLLIPQTDRNGLHLRALFTFATQLSKIDSTEEAMEFLNNAVTTINALSNKNKKEDDAQTVTEAAMAESDDPNTLFDSSQMDQAFSSVAALDLDRTLAQAKRIDSKPIQLLARIEAIQPAIKRLAQKPKTVPKSPKLLGSQKQ